MKKIHEASAIILATILVGVALAVALPQLTNKTPLSASSTSNESPTVFASKVAPDGLQLKMVLNATAMSPNGVILGNLSVVDTSNQNVTVTTVASQNMTIWDSYNDNCGMPYFMGYAVFVGHYTVGNISLAGAPLTLTPRVASAACSGGPIPSQMMFFPGVQGMVGGVIDPNRPHDTFQNLVNMTTDVCADTRYLVQGCRASYPGLVGDWNTTSSPPEIVPFSPGEYTILAWDDWNQYVYGTFIVWS